MKPFERIAAALVLLALSCLAPAHADQMFGDEPSAAAACSSGAAWEESEYRRRYPNGSVETACKRVADLPGAPAHSRFECTQRNKASSSGTWSSWMICNYAGDSYYRFPKTGSCNGYGIDPYNSTQCMSDEKCRAENAKLGPGGPAERTMTSESYCPKFGCQMRVQPGTATKRNGQGGTLVSGIFEYTGEACSTSPTNPVPPPEKLKPKPDPQECVTYQSGQKMCQKTDGQQCYTTTNGRQTCWRPGEVGEKTDGPVMQKRNAGPTEIPPQNLQLPSGDSLQKTGESMTETTQQKNGTTSTTTTSNYTTTNGTNANGGKDGAKDSGESGTGDGSGKTGEGDDKGTASGGGDCKTPPIVNGDQVLGMVATQAWHTRCAVEAGNAAKVTGDVADCKSQFTVEGDNANAVKLRAMRGQLCNGDKDGDGQPDWTKPDGTEAGEGGDDGEKSILQRLVSTDVLDAGGFLGGGSASCPQLGSIEFGVFGSFSLDSQPWFCDLVALMRGVLLLVGAFIALRILTGDGI